MAPHPPRFPLLSPLSSHNPSLLSPQLSPSPGKDFYGPEGVYPFAGRECARALGLMSTELSDCSDDLGGLTLSELDTLRDWQGRFWAKYPVVGRTAAGAGGRPEAPAPAAETKKGA